MSTYRFNTNVMRSLIYVLLIVLLVVTIIPIWLVRVNATRSTPEIQKGLSALPSTHLGDNYQIWVGKGMDMVQGFTNSRVLALCKTGWGAVRV